ncbi:MAG: rpfC [Myxococcaceae bacterium]|nr:rpfC [Myxococcaceae bacterium]
MTSGKAGEGLEVAAARGFLEGGGVCGALVRSIDWSTTSLGPLATWPRALQTAVGIVLHARQPMTLAWGPDFIQIYNDAYIPSFGLGKHPVAMGQRGRDCWGDDTWPVVGAQIEEVMSKGVASWNEDALIPVLRNGRMEEAHWIYGFSPVYDDDDRIGGVLCTSMEVTSRVLTERRQKVIQTLGVRTSECHDISVIADLVAEVIASAPDFIFGASYEVREATGSPVRRRAANLEEPFWGAVDALVCEYLEAPEPRVMASAGALGKGDEHTTPHQAFVTGLKSFGGAVLVFGLNPRIPFDDAYRDFVAAFVNAIDSIGARLQAIQLRNERDMLTVQAPVPTALMTGPDHVFEIANEAYIRMVGRDPTGKPYREAFPELVGTALPGTLDQIYRTGEPFETAESRALIDIDNDGVLEERFFKFTVSALRDAGRRIHGLMAMGIDITEQVQARHIVERALFERELLLGQVEAANHAKDEFLATVSHELRTPLTAILGWARLLGEGDDLARVKKGLAVIKRNANAQAQLLDDLLDISRIISGQVRLNMRPVDPAEIVSAAIESVRPQAGVKDISLLVNVDLSVRRLIADEGRLQQIVWNLLANAVKFTPRGGEINVQVAQQDARMVITVRDTGRGISPAFLPHVFDRFRQDDASTTKQQVGLGLGLAIVRHLVELHGGSVVARSDGEGRGATFEVSLPIDLTHAANASLLPVQLEDEVSESRAAPLRDVRVLVVDDQEDTRDLIATVLEDAGARVSQAHSVATAMQALLNGDVHVVLSDIGMPGQDGYALIQQLRADGSLRLQGLPAVALTAHARPEDRQKALAAGFQDYITKPIDADRLIAVVAYLSRP